MQCDLCGNKFRDNHVYSYEDVDGSKLCKFCYDAVTGVKEAEVESTMVVTDEQAGYVDLSNTKTCRSCKAICDNEENFCGSCGAWLYKNSYSNAANGLLENLQFIACPACNTNNEGARQFCKSCGNFLYNTLLSVKGESSKNSEKPISGCLSILSIPAGLLFTIIFISSAGIQDSWGFGVLLFVVLFVLVSAIFGIFSGAFAITPGKESEESSNSNATLGIIGMIVGVIVISIIILLFRG